jgi:uncharacterized protein (TIGR00369 family)
MTQSYRYGLAKPEEVAGKTGLQVLLDIIEGRTPQATISQRLDFWIVEASDGFAAFEGEPSAHILNPMGSVHGGWALTLIDSVTGCSCLTKLPAGVGYTTVETKGNMVKAITPKTGRVRAEGRVISAGRQIMTAEGRVMDASGTLLAHGTSTMIVLQPKA